MEIVQDRRLKIWSPLLVLLVIFVFYAFLVGIPTSYFYIDEGWAAELSSRILRGKILYRDVIFPYGPVLPTIYAAVFRCTGDIQFYHLRLAGLLAILFSGIILYGISYSVVRKSWLSLLAPLALFCSLGLYQSCRLSASTLGGLLSLICIMIHLWDMAYPRLYKIAFLGVLIGITILTKHNIALIDLAAHSVIILRRSRFGAMQYMKTVFLRLSILYFMGFLAIIVGCYICHTTPALFLNVGFLTNLNPHYAKKLMKPFPWPWHLLSTPGRAFWERALVFYSPWGLLLLILISSPSRFFRKISTDNRILLIYTVAYAQYAQIFPLSDFSHYVRATMVACLVFPFALNELYLQWSSQQSSGKKPPVLLLGGLFFLACFSFHTGYFIKSQLSVIEKYPPPSVLPHSKYIRRGWNEEIIADVARTVRMRPEERMLIAGIENFYHLFAKKPAVLKWYNLTPLMVYSKEKELSIVNDMKQMDINLVLKCPSRIPGTTTSISSVEELPALWTFITNNYSTVQRIHGYEIMIKTTEAL